jgi:hypothetical protein
MKNRFVWAGALALAVAVTSQLELKAGIFTNSDGIIITNGTIIITTRTANDNFFFGTYASSSIWDGDDPRGPGNTPGDAAMAILLQDHGYSVRIVPEKALSWVDKSGNPQMDHYLNPNNPLLYYTGQSGPSPVGQNNVQWSAALVIMSGSGSGADMVTVNTNGIPIIAGEHGVLGDASNTSGPPGGHAELFLYANKNNNSANWSPTTAGYSPYMKVLLPNHPIMQGIPLDAQGRVKIIRSPYPSEGAFVPPGGLTNYPPSWTTVDIGEGKAVPTTGLQIIGVLDTATNRAVFATLEKGSVFSTDTNDPDSPWNGYTTAPSRLVHFFVNENGSGNSRRAFNTLTDIGKVIFVRTCKWAMGETLQPYQGLGIIDITPAGNQQVKLSWQGSDKNNYRIIGTTDFANWQTISDDIPGAKGIVARTLNIAAGPRAVYMQVAALP